MPGNIIIDNSPNYYHWFPNLYEYKYDQNTQPRGKAAMGNFVDLQVQGSNSVDSLRRKLYIPKPIFLHNLYKSISTISNNKSYNLSWNPDPQNMFGKVYIEISYCPEISHHNNSGNPKSVKSLTYTVNDNGNYSIPAADLKRFPVSSYISISISRASDNSWPTDKSRIEYLAILTASHFLSLFKINYVFIL